MRFSDANKAATTSQATTHPFPSSSSTASCVPNSPLMSRLTFPPLCSAFRSSAPCAPSSPPMCVLRAASGPAPLLCRHLYTHKYKPYVFSNHPSHSSSQVFRALRPQLTSDVCCTLLVALHHCFAAAAAATSPHATAGGVGGGSAQGSKAAASAFDLRDSLGLPSVSTQHTGGEPSGPPLVTCLACAQEIITTLKGEGRATTDRVERAGGLDPLQPCVPVCKSDGRQQVKWIGSSPLLSFCSQSLIEGLEPSGRLVIYPQVSQWEIEAYVVQCIKLKEEKMNKKEAPAWRVACHPPSGRSVGE
eukprot:1161406-Pelagomonas_calceolata.AAC.2